MRPIGSFAVSARRVVPFPTGYAACLPRVCYFLRVPPRGEDRHRIGVFGIYLPVLARKPGALAQW